MTALFHGTLTRRHFLGTSAAALVASALPSAASAQGARFRRFEISDPGMPPRVLDSYKKGIREMLNRPPTDPRNWYRNAFIHVFDCPHQNWWFLAWHRAYIGWLEATIRAFSGDAEFALPYWDWTKTPRVPAAMFDDVLDPNNGAFIATFDAFKAQFDAAVTALWATFSQAQQDVLAQRGAEQHGGFLECRGRGSGGNVFRAARCARPQPREPRSRSNHQGDGCAAHHQERVAHGELRRKREWSRRRRVCKGEGGKPQRAGPGRHSGEPAARQRARRHGRRGGQRLHGVLPVAGRPHLLPAPWQPRPAVVRVDPPASRARASDAAARRGFHGMVERAIPVLQRCKRPAGGEDQRGRLRGDERLRLRLFTGLGRGSGAGARDACGGIAADAGFHRADHLRDHRRRRAGGWRRAGARGRA